MEITFDKLIEVSNFLDKTLANGAKLVLNKCYLGAVPGLGGRKKEFLPRGTVLKFFDTRGDILFVESYPNVILHNDFFGYIKIPVGEFMDFVNERCTLINKVK